MFASWPHPLPLCREILPSFQKSKNMPKPLRKKDYGQTDENMVLIYGGIPSTPHWPQATGVSTTDEVLIDYFPRIFAST